MSIDPIGFIHQQIITTYLVSRPYCVALDPFRVTDTSPKWINGEGLTISRTIIRHVYVYLSMINDAKYLFFLNRRSLGKPKESQTITSVILFNAFVKSFPSKITTALF